MFEKLHKEEAQINKEFKDLTLEEVVESFLATQKKALKKAGITNTDEYKLSGILSFDVNGIQINIIAGSLNEFMSAISSNTSTVEPGPTTEGVCLDPNCDCKKNVVWN
jgi:hypothetical protein